MAESGFKAGEVSCSCGESFDTVDELISHAASSHGVDVE